MSEHLKLGRLITSPQERDAVHVAVAPVEAGALLRPGQHVGVVDGKAVTDEPHVGVVDPFLKQPVDIGDRCWLFLYPGSIASLRHLWSHSAFPIDNPTDADKKAEAEAWIRKYLHDSGEDVTYDLFIRVCDDGDQYTAYGHDLHLSISDEAWEKVSIVTGRTYDKGHRDETYFSCSC
jgi:hypothetical protein